MFDQLQRVDRVNIRKLRFLVMAIRSVPGTTTTSTFCPFRVRVCSEFSRRSCGGLRKRQVQRVPVPLGASLFEGKRKTEAIEAILGGPPKRRHAHSFGAEAVVPCEVPESGLPWIFPELARYLNR